MKKAAPEFVEVVKYFKGEKNTITGQLPRQTAKDSLTKPFEFNRIDEIDVNYVVDTAGEDFKRFNVLCFGMDMRLVTSMNAGKGTPSSDHCYQTFMGRWVD